MEEEDTKEDDEVLVIIKRTSGKCRGVNKDKGSNKDAFETIKAFKE